MLLALRLILAFFWLAFFCWILSLPGYWIFGDLYPAYNTLGVGGSLFFGFAIVEVWYAVLVLLLLGDDWFRVGFIVAILFFALLAQTIFFLWGFWMALFLALAGVLALHWKISPFWGGPEWICRQFLIPIA